MTELISRARFLELLGGGALSVPAWTQSRTVTAAHTSPVRHEDPNEMAAGAASSQEIDELFESSVIFDRVVNLGVERNLVSARVWPQGEIKRRTGLDMGNHSIRLETLARFRSAVEENTDALLMSTPATSRAPSSRGATGCCCTCASACGPSSPPTGPTRSVAGPTTTSGSPRSAGKPCAS